MNEIELAERCGRGESLARKQLYDLYAGQLMAICLRYVGERESAEDVLHDGFLKIFRTIHHFTFRGKGSLFAWLSKVIANEALSHIRNEARLQQEEMPTRELPDLPDEEEDLDQIPRDVLMSFIRELPNGYRTVFNLYVFEEKSHKEIASLLGITEHSSSSQFYRARILLMKRIKNYKGTIRT